MRQVNVALRLREPSLPGLIRRAPSIPMPTDASHVELADEAVRIGPSLAAASALSIALATFACGRLTSLFGERTYLVMADLVLALVAAALKWRIEI